MGHGSDALPPVPSLFDVANKGVGEKGLTVRRFGGRSARRATKDGPYIPIMSRLK